MSLLYKNLCTLSVIGLQTNEADGHSSIASLELAGVYGSKIPDRRNRIFSEPEKGNLAVVPSRLVLWD